MTRPDPRCWSTHSTHDHTRNCWCTCAGRFIFVQYPYVARALAPLAPVNALYHLFPFAPFVIFLAVYAGVVNNQSLSRYVRYNAAQAVLLDILLMCAAAPIGAAVWSRKGAVQSSLVCGHRNGSSSASL